MHQRRIVKVQPLDLKQKSNHRRANHQNARNEGRIRPNASWTEPKNRKTAQVKACFDTPILLSLNDLGRLARDNTRKHEQIHKQI